MEKLESNLGGKSSVSYIGNFLNSFALGTALFVGGIGTVGLEGCCSSQPTYECRPVSRPVSRSSSSWYKKTVTIEKHRR